MPMKTLRLALAGLLAAVGLVLLAPATPSYACSCAISGPAQYVEYADTIFTGTLTAVEEAPPDEDGVISSMDPTVYTFEPDQVLEGDVASTAEVSSARYGASCGLEGLQSGETYLVFANDRRGALEANLCGGTQPADDAIVDRVWELTGPHDPAAPVTTDAEVVVAAILALFGLASS